MNGRSTAADIADVKRRTQPAGTGHRERLCRARFRPNSQSCERSWQERLRSAAFDDFGAGRAGDRTRRPQTAADIGRMYCGIRSISTGFVTADDGVLPWRDILRRTATDGAAADRSAPAGPPGPSFARRSAPSRCIIKDVRVHSTPCRCGDRNLIVCCFGNAEITIHAVDYLYSARVANRRNFPGHADRLQLVQGRVLDFELGCRERGPSIRLPRICFSFSWPRHCRSPGGWRWRRERDGRAMDRDAVALVGKQCARPHAASFPRCEIPRGADPDGGFVRTGLLGHISLLLHRQQGRR